MRRCAYRSLLSRCESIALLKGAVVREFRRQQAASGSVSTNTPAYVPVDGAIYRVRVTIGVRWADGSQSRYTIWTKYSPVIPAC